ncbi:MAG: hypothetical protein LBE51_20120 [Acidovorax sp.]|jgi:hypothetical protein|nr:hypothetical protein [Acidovorax sp.]
MIKLSPGLSQNIIIRPRWPSSAVFVDPDVFIRLQQIQAKLPAEVQLILTRGYEQPHSSLGMLRRIFRQLGIRIFTALYPARKSEVYDIFGPNGHDVDGTHIDVSMAIKGRRIRFLRLGVFTPLSWQKQAIKNNFPYMEMVKNALRAADFEIHKNETESNQIHCDLIRNNAFVGK